MIDDYVDRKHGRKAVSYLVPQLAPILEETYGVIVYQEQVMKIAGVLARYSMAEADDLRKAMGKKITEIMAAHRERFIKGAMENGVVPEKAANIFDLMEKFGGYGFNKSHSAAYALIAYQTAYLKAHFPVEFLAALLTSEMGSIDNIVKFVAECRSHDIPVLPPDINRSYKDFTVDGDRIRFGLVAVKNVGEGAIDAMIAARQERPFDSFFDFCERVDLKKVNKRVVESLIKCGAFDTTGLRRSQMMGALELALDYGQRAQRERCDPQMTLFGGAECPLPVNLPAVPDIDEWDERQKLAFEKESLGFYLSGHPLTRFEDLLSKFTTADALSIKEASDGAVVRIGGLVRGTKTIKTRKGDLMAFVTIEDIHGALEVTVFSRLYEKCVELLTDDTPVLVQGQVQKDEQSVKLVADSMIALEKAEENWTASVHVNLDLGRTDRALLLRLRELLQRFPGPCKAFLHLRGPTRTEALIELAEGFHLKAGPALRREVRELLGYPAVETRCTPMERPRERPAFGARPTAH
jgi:DNA polymerase-3 subunit alpha